MFLLFFGFFYNDALHSFLNTFVALRTLTFSFTLLPVSHWNHTNLKLQSKNMEYYAALIRSSERNTVAVFLVLLYNTLQPPIFHHSFTAMSSVILFWPFSILRSVIFISSCLCIILHIVHCMIPTFLPLLVSNSWILSTCHIDPISGVIPLPLKKPGADSLNLNNCNPIANSPLLSNTIEKKICWYTDLV